MLMLTRRKGEAVDIFDKDGMVIASIIVGELLPNGAVRLGFDVLPEFVIMRDNAKVRSQKKAEARFEENDGVSHEAATSGPTITYRSRKPQE